MPILNAPFFHEVGVVKNNKKIKWFKNLIFHMAKKKPMVMQEFLMREMLVLQNKICWF